MVDAAEIRPGAEIVGSDGIHVGIVGTVDAGGIVPAGRDSSEDGGPAVTLHDTSETHRLGLDLVDRLDDGTVVLTIDAAAAVILAIGAAA